MTRTPASYLDNGSNLIRYPLCAPEFLLLADSACSAHAGRDVLRPWSCSRAARMSGRLLGVFPVHINPLLTVESDAKAQEVGLLQLRTFAFKSSSLA